MIERIYIPTIKRPKLQVTYEHLPAELQQRAIMVIDGSERHLYEYDCDYLELPESIIGEYTQLALTRKYIHEHASKDKIKYAMLDDDIEVVKRNNKYFGGSADMEASSRIATDDDLFELYTMASEALDVEHMGVVGLAYGASGPPKDGKTYHDSTRVFNYLFLDGKKIAGIIDQIDTSVRVAEDCMFLFCALTNGINSRMLLTYSYKNYSEGKSYDNIRPVWQGLYSDGKVPKDYYATLEHYNALVKVRNKYPFITFKEQNGEVVNRKHWKKAYEYGRTKADMARTQSYLQKLESGDA